MRRGAQGRGVTQPPQGYDLRVWGRFGNQKRELGVDLIMRELEAYGHRATFFVEPLGSSHFGIDGLREVCDTMRSRGHDVQLHAHPIQKQIDWWTRGIAPPAALRVMLCDRDTFSPDLLPAFERTPVRHPVCFTAQPLPYASAIWVRSCAGQPRVMDGDKLYPGCKPYFDVAGWLKGGSGRPDPAYRLLYRLLG